MTDALTLAVAVIASLSAVAAAQEVSDRPLFESSIRPLLSKYCADCHGIRKQSADLRVDQLDANFKSRSSADRWVELMDRLNLGEMPPPDQPQPSDDDRATIVQWVASKLREAALRRVGSQTALRRLNRQEYSNTVRDLLHMRFLPGEDPVQWLPADGNYNGYEKVGAALMVDASLLDKYYIAARRIADRAIVVGPPPFPTHRIRFEMEDMAKKGSGFAYVCGHSGCDCREHDVRLLAGNTRTGRGLLYPGTERMIPTKGFYTIRVRASADVGEGDEAVRMFVERQNGREGRIMEVDVTATPAKPQIYSATLPMDALPEAQGVYMKVGIVNGAKRVQPSRLQSPERAIGVGIPDFFDFERAMKAAASRGDHAESLRIAARRRSEGWTGSTRPGMGLLDPRPLRKLYIDWIEIEGPLYDQWPPKSHRELMGDESPASPTITDVRAMFARFLPRAYRRPVEDAEVEKVVRLVHDELQSGAAFEDAMRLGLAYALSSPSFLYLAESGDGNSTLNAYELASRLSYFLWSSMPDDRLFELAQTRAILDQDVLRREASRMLEDPKSQSLIDDFARQWLKTDEFLDFMPDSKIYAKFYRDYPSRLRHDMAQEPLAFFAEVLRQDLSVLNFIDSDFLVVNEPLANFYGMALPSQDEDGEPVDRLTFRRVPRPRGSPRGGLLGQAGVHLRGSDGARTKPVNRGVYIREVFFNDPPDPPPPNAGEVEPNIEGQQLTVRERLLQHQQIEACAQCHRRIDPYGLALENFDVTGAWRERQNGEEFRGSRTPMIDASGVLPNGKSFANFTEFKARLLEQDARFRRALVEHLMLYALGRPTTTADRASIEQVVKDMTAPHAADSLRDAILGIVMTREFRVK